MRWHLVAIGLRNMLLKERRRKLKRRHRGRGKDRDDVVSEISRCYLHSKMEASAARLYPAVVCAACCYRHCARCVALASRCSLYASAAKRAVPGIIDAAPYIWSDSRLEFFSSPPPSYLGALKVVLRESDLLIHPRRDTQYHPEG